MEYEDEMFEKQEEPCDEKSTESNIRGSAIRRHNARKKKARRKKIVDLRCWSSAKEKPVFSVRLRRYHSKTNNKGKRRWRYGNYDRAKNWDAKYQRRIDQMKDDVDEHDSEQ